MKDLGQKRVKVEEPWGKQEEEEPEGNITIEPDLFPILTDEELKQMIDEWKSMKPLWTISIPSLRPSSICMEQDTEPII